jgi:hypothetical protein
MGHHAAQPAHRRRRLHCGRGSRSAGHGERSYDSRNLVILDAGGEHKRLEVDLQLNERLDLDSCIERQFLLHLGELVIRQGRGRFRRIALSA